MLVRYIDLEGICPLTSYRGISFAHGEWVIVPDDIAAALEGNAFFERAIEAEAVEVKAEDAAPVPEAITDLDPPAGKRGRGKKAD